MNKYVKDSIFIKQFIAFPLMIFNKKRIAQDLNDCVRFGVDDMRISNLMNSFR